MKLREVKYYYDYDSLVLQSIAFLDEQNRRQGVFRAFFEDGKICAEINYKNNRMHGQHMMYWDKDIVKTCCFVNGLLEGREEWFHKIKNEMAQINHYKHYVKFGEDIEYFNIWMN